MLISAGLTLREIERQSIEQSLKRNQWKRMVTVRELGADKNTLRCKIKGPGIAIPGYGNIDRFDRRVCCWLRHWCCYSSQIQEFLYFKRVVRPLLNHSRHFESF
ncbi:MAG: hypothetical protein RBR67_17915 [Desulfobacterium sp.]|nr:hypothetical protein [Desulfobacterium sp.]